MTLLRNTLIVGSFILIFLSSIIMGNGEGRVIALNYQYTWKSVLIPATIYLCGAVIYFTGTLAVAQYFGLIIAIWEFGAITSWLYSYIKELTLQGAKIQITPTIVICVVSIFLGLAAITYAGNTLADHIKDQAAKQGIVVEGDH